MPGHLGATIWHQDGDILDWSDVLGDLVLEHIVIVLLRECIDLSILGALH